MIKIEKVNKYFNKHKKSEIHIINNTSLEFGNTGLVAILGKSGSGKTTLLNVIGGLDKVSSGKIYINGKKITQKTSNYIDKIRNLNIGYIFQDYKLIDHMSVFENVAISLRMIGLKDKKEIEKRVNYVLEAVNMYRYRNRPAEMLSGGEKQRVAIARAIVKNPSIVIADEPTGNLDSKNSLEVMNIIKAISKEKLVILVTHEVELANFYATRIVELQDGKIVKDYKNEEKDSLEYRLDNKIYLKDFKNIETLKSKDINLDIYSDASKKLDVKLIVKNGNILIEAKNHKIEIVDETSAIELVNDNYKKIDKSIYEKYNYNIDEIADNKYKIKYSSIYSIIKSIKTGFNRIANYTILKKLMLLGFFMSSMFVVYSICNMAGFMEIRKEDYLTCDENYLKVNTANIKLDDYLKYENNENIDYIIPGEGKANFKIKMDNYYQLSRYSFELTGVLADIEKVNEISIVNGRMPKNEYEIIIDKTVATNMLNESFSMIKGMGIKKEEELLNRVVTIDEMNEFKIVGFVDNKSKSIYVKKEFFINILNGSTESNMGMGIYYEQLDEEELSNIKVKDYNLFLEDIKLTNGKLPENDYEVIVNKLNSEDMKLNNTIKTEVNGNKLKVVGFYESKSNKQDYLVNNNTVKYNLISNSNNFLIYPKNKEKTLNEFKNIYHLDIIDIAEKEKQKYLNYRKESIKSSITFACAILVISLFEIYLMIRSSYLSRIKEIGILRAIGIKKKDIYRMFLGEILVITSLSSMPGLMLMTYILSQIAKIPYADRSFIVNVKTVGLCIFIIYMFNIIVGLIPLFNVIRKRPSEIFARRDIE